MIKEKIWSLKFRKPTLAFSRRTLHWWRHSVMILFRKLTGNSGCRLFLSPVFDLIRSVHVMRFKPSRPFDHFITVLEFCLISFYLLHIFAGVWVELQKHMEDPDMVVSKVPVARTSLYFWVQVCCVLCCTETSGQGTGCASQGGQWCWCSPQPCDTEQGYWIVGWTRLGSFFHNSFLQLQSAERHLSDSHNLCIVAIWTVGFEP